MRAKQKKGGNRPFGPGSLPSGHKAKGIRPWADLRIGESYIEPYRPGVMPATTRNRAVASACAWAKRKKPYAEFCSRFTAHGVLVTRTC